MLSLNRKTDYALVALADMAEWVDAERIELPRLPRPWR